MAIRNTKDNFAAARERVLSRSGKEYWRSIEELVDAPGFEELVKREYPVHSEDWNMAFSRRSFVKLMGGTLALAGLSGCVIQPPEKIVPYVHNDEDLLPGKPLYFATAMTLGGIATGLLAKSYDGRPIKLEGNPGHPQSLGATDVFAQASLLDMYDPDRSQEITSRGAPSTWQIFMRAMRSAIDENRTDGGAGIRFLTETVTSPTLQAQFRQIASELPNARWYQYEPVNNDNAIMGARMAFGSPVNTVYRFDQADRILTLDKDIFSDFNVRYKKDYAKRKNYRPDNHNIARLYAVETMMTPTGAKADHRLAVKPSEVPDIARAIAVAVGVGGAAAGSSPHAAWIAAMAKDLMEHRGRSVVVPGEFQPPIVHAIAHAINGALGNVGTTVVYTDPLTPSEKTQIEQLRELVSDIDAGRVKMLVILGGNPVYNTPADLKLNRERMEKVPLRVHLGSHWDETGELCHWHVSQKHYLETWGDARAYDGTVTLMQPLIQPLYESKSVYEVVQLFMREDFDKRDYDIVKGYWQTQNLNFAAGSAPGTQGTPSNQPPGTGQNGAQHGTAGNQQEGAGTRQISSPGTAGSSAGGRSAVSGQQNVSTPAQNTIPPATTAPAPSQIGQRGAAASMTYEDRWRQIVHDGFIPNSALPTRTMLAGGAFFAEPPQPAAAGLQIAIRPDPCIFDGRFSNNGWLQEMPKPLNKITWDNVALVSPATARRLGLNQGNDTDEISGGERPAAFITSKGNNMYSDLATITYQDGRIQKGVPVWISPGQPDDVVTLFMGYGRTRAGRIGTGIGYNVFDVMRSDAMYAGAGELGRTGEQTTIASTQIHFNMEGRDLLRVWDIHNLENEIEAGKQQDFYPLSMYYEAYKEEYKPTYEANYKWGMSIDLNSCIGCNACVMACQAENNIPVVGKEQVERAREMHWLRIDTYYGGTDINNPDGPHFQPVLCMQCEQAPCEVVCPVHATAHSAEGLNDMVYNRCVGTRYCSNNCPYKVRRFNFMLYQDWDTPQYKLMRNPDVTVRSRGVMEKCTYCTQRISQARIEAEKDGRKIRDGEVLTACQAVCPTDAIIFGDMNDQGSAVAQIKQDPRNYNLLNELNTQPRTTYMAELKNQNREMPDYRPPSPKAHEVHKEGRASEGSEDH